MKAWRNGAHGEIGKDSVFVSDLVAQAMLAGATGDIHISLGETDARIFFANGAPIHASGTAVLSDFIGQILVERGFCDNAVIEAAYGAQEVETASAPDRRRPIGAILAVNAQIAPEAIRAAVEAQVERRLCAIGAIDHGKWATTNGSNDDIKPIAAPIEGYSVLAEMLRNASERELTDISDTMLGHSVRTNAPSAALAKLMLTDDERAIIAYLDRPRKVNHLEVMSSRKKVRALMKVLSALGFLELLPADKGMPIKEAVKVPKLANSSSVAGVEPPPPEPTPAPAQEPAARSAAPAQPAPSSFSKIDPVLALDLQTKASEIGKVSYYELLDVLPKSDTNAIRNAYTALAKRFHPDLFQSADEEINSVARSVVSALNDAYTALMDADRRKKYDKQLAKGHGLTEDTGQRAGGAKVKYEMALVHLRKHEYQKARESLKMAMEMHQEHGLYKGTFAWALYADPSVDRGEAVTRASRLLEEALLLSPKEGALHYFHGRVLKERGEMEQAETAFRRALGYEPKHKDAAMEVRLLDMRKKATASDEDEVAAKPTKPGRPVVSGAKKKAPGFFARLFKRS